MSDYKAIESKLNQLQAEINEAAAAAAKRRKTLSVIFVVLVVICAGYMGFAYAQISKVDAPTVVVLAEEQANPFLNQTAQEWADQLTAQAPGLMDTAAEAALTIPDTADQRLQAYLDAMIEDQMPQLEEQFKEVVILLLAQMDDAVTENADDAPLTEAQAEEMLTLVAKGFGESTNAELDKVYGRYTAISSGLLEQLDHLAVGQGLTQKEQLQRDILVSFLALLERVDTQGS